jgi:hypothetical protein
MMPATILLTALQIKLFNKKTGALLLTGVVMLCDFAFAQQMFRGTADHNYNYNSQVKGAFNELAWKFYADAPVRSSITWANDAVYFGSSKGIFYSLNRNSGTIKWSFNARSAINSSAAYQNGNVFFSDNRQVLYSLNASTGKVNWKTSLGQSKNYEWAFDYYYSSPTIAGDQVLIGSKDGFVYNINKATGKVKWKFKTGGIVRSTDIGRMYGPFDLAFMPINGARQNDGRFTDVGIPCVLTPEQAVIAAKLLGAKAICPMHYGKPDENYFEVPNAEARFLAAAKENNMKTVLLKKGEWLNWQSI